MEEFELRVDKASEFEVTLYDRVDGQQIPIGLFWVKLAEIVDDLRRATVGAESEQMSGWAPATEDGSGPIRQRAQIGQITKDGIECWWDVEPVGQISMRLNFSK
jgi:hypothetical protein